MREIVVGHQHLELGIKCEKRLQQVLLSPKAKFIHNPVAAVVEGKKDIVDVHNDAGI